MMSPKIVVLLFAATVARPTTAACTFWNPPSGIGLGCVEGDDPVLATDPDCPKQTVGECRMVEVTQCLSVVDDPQETPRTLPTRFAWLKIGEPSPGTFERGTIVIMDGGPGSGWPELASTNPKPPAISTPASADLIRSLQDEGFRTVQVAWDANASPAVAWWASAPPAPIRQEGYVRTSCRSATLFRYLHDTTSPRSYFSPRTAFCGTGNSSGAGQLAYALASYGQGNDKTDPKRIFDAVILSNGPIFVDLDLSCDPNSPLPIGGPSAGNAIFEITQFGGQQSIDTAFGELFGDGPCSNSPYSPSGSCSPGACAPRPDILDQSSLRENTAAVYKTYPQTSVTVLSAGNWSDAKPKYPTCAIPAVAPCCLLTCPPGSLINGSCCWEGDDEYGSAWSADQWNTFLAGQPGHGPVSFRNDLTDQEHGMTSRVKGAHAVRDVLIQECVPR